MAGVGVPAVAMVGKQGGGVKLVSGMQPSTEPPRKMFRVVPMTAVPMFKLVAFVTSKLLLIAAAMARPISPCV